MTPGLSSPAAGSLVPVPPSVQAVEVVLLSGSTALEELLLSVGLALILQLRQGLLRRDM